MKETVVLKMSALLELLAKKESARIKINSKDNVFGGRVKKSGKEVSVSIIFSDHNLIMHLSAAPVSFLDDFYAQIDSQKEFDNKFAEIEAYLKLCFAKSVNK